MLNDRFLEIWEEQCGGLDQHQLRDKLFASLSAAEYGDVLYEALLPAAHKFILSRRGEKPAKASAASVRANAGQKHQRTAGAANSARSSKVRSLRERWPMLKHSYAVAYGGVRKNLESMTASDCRASAEIHKKSANGTMRRAEWLETVADELVTHKAATVAKLPAAVLSKLQNSAP